MKSKFNGILSSYHNILSIFSHDDITCTISGLNVGQHRSKLVNLPTIYHSGPKLETPGIET
jgi:hypothetical protein